MRFTHAEKDGEVLKRADNPTKSCKARGSHLRVHFKMDWQGQKLAEQLMQIMLVSSAVVAFISGYVLGSFQIMLLIYAAGVLLTSLITVPNWPFLNRHPLKWLDPSEAEKHPKPVSANTSSKKKAGKK
nr:probable signal peptidase complex subunit 1 isoform X3 [Coffea arabica]